MSVADDLPELVARDIEAFVSTQRQRLQALGPDLVVFLDAAQAAVDGGKRLRAAFCQAGWLAAGGDPDDRSIVWAAASLEWLQASALVHDDVMDGSDVRRGLPSAHRRFQQVHDDSPWSGSAERFGVGAAILLGDLLLSWCDEMFRSSGLPDEALARATPFLDACRTEVVSGQYLDLVGQARGTTSIDDAMRIVRYKAAKYTVERPLHVGAATAGASPDLMAALTAFGVPLGEAFQLRDDVLGVFGDPEVTGKPAGDDLREGKRTVLIAHTAAGSTSEQRRWLDARLGDIEMDEATVGQVRELIVGTGALDQVEKDIADLEQAATRALAAAPIATSSARELCSDLAARSTRRVR